MRKHERWLRNTARATTDEHLAAGLRACADEMARMDQKLDNARYGFETGIAETLLHVAIKLGIPNPELATMDHIEHAIEVATHNAKL